MISTTLAPLLLAGALAYPSPLRFESDHSWAGRTVIMKKTGARLFRTNADGIDTQVGTLNRTDYVVIREHDGKLWVRQDNIEGWFPKEEAALPEDGVAHFTKLIQANPNDAAQFARRSKAHELNGDLDAALKDYDEAIRLAPTGSSWWNNRANLYQKKKDFDRARQDYDRSIELNPNSAIVYGNRGNAYNNLHDFERAIADYDKALQLNPNYTNAIANRGNAHREMHEFDKALSDYNAALKIDPRFAYALSSRGALWVMRKDYDKALTDIGAALRADPRSALAYLYRGNVRRANKQYSLALDDYDHSLWLDPRMTSAVIERGVARSELKAYDKALKDFDAALKTEPKSLRALNAKAWLLATCPDQNFRNGKLAVELALQAITVGHDKNGKSYAVLAAAYAEVGNFIEAAANQRRALELKDYAETEADAGKQRLKLYEMKMPYRDQAEP
jgi:tetratricopeptide (TPR) repeat protein